MERALVNRSQRHSAVSAGVGETSRLVGRPPQVVRQRQHGDQSRCIRRLTMLEEEDVLAVGPGKAPRVFLLVAVEESEQQRARTSNAKQSILFPSVVGQLCRARHIARPLTLFPRRPELRGYFC